VRVCVHATGSARNTHARACCLGRVGGVWALRAQRAAQTALGRVRNAAQQPVQAGRALRPPSFSRTHPRQAASAGTHCCLCAATRTPAHPQHARWQPTLPFSRAACRSWPTTSSESESCLQSTTEQEASAAGEGWGGEGLHPTAPHQMPRAAAACRRSTADCAAPATREAEHPLLLLPLPLPPMAAPAELLPEGASTDRSQKRRRRSCWCGACIAGGARPTNTSPSGPGWLSHHQLAGGHADRNPGHLRGRRLAISVLKDRVAAGSGGSRGAGGCVGTYSWGQGPAQPAQGSSWVRAWRAWQHATRRWLGRQAHRRLLQQQESGAAAAAAAAWAAGQGEQRARERQRGCGAGAQGTSQRGVAKSQDHQHHHHHDQEEGGG